MQEHKRSKITRSEPLHSKLKALIGLLSGENDEIQQENAQILVLLCYNSLFLQ